MEIRSYDLNSYKLHLIKTDKSKVCHMEIHFRDEVKKENLNFKTFLCDILTDCSKIYSTRKDVVIKLEELYKAFFYGTASKTGGIINTMFIYDFIAPHYISEEGYLEKALMLPFEMILKPKVINNEFEIKTFNIIKERMKRSIESINEDPTKLSINNALQKMDKDSKTSYSVLGTLEELENITPVTLYKEYQNMINNNHCDVFLIGNIDFDEVYKIISKVFKLRTIKTSKLSLHIENKLRKKPLTIIDNANFVQSNLNLIFNLNGLTIEEKNINIQVFNYIFGSGGLSSKLYQKVREENSLCYGIYSIYLKYDNLLIVQVSLDESGRKKAIKLIMNCLKEMIKGNFSEENLEDAKNNLLFSLNISLDNNISILNNYVFNVYDNLPPIEDRMALLKQINKKQIVEVAKKIKINTIYTLKSEVVK